MRSGLSIGRRVSPLCPTCPPLAFPNRPRWLLSTRGGFFRPSLDGGLLLLELVLSSRRCSSVTSCLRAAFSWLRAAFSVRRASTSRRSVPIRSARAGVSSTPVLSHGKGGRASRIGEGCENAVLLWPLRLTAGPPRGGGWELRVNK